MGWTFLAGAGRLLWPVIGALVPAAGPRLTTLLLCLLLAAIAIGAPAGSIWLSMRGQLKAERLARDLHWQTELTKANQTHAQTLEVARRAADRVAATPDDRAERMRVCRESPTCRDRGR